MSSGCDVERVVWQCTLCETQFEGRVADPGADGLPRCPQCFLSSVRRVPPEEISDLVVSERTPFR